MRFFRKKKQNIQSILRRDSQAMGWENDLMKFHDKISLQEAKFIFEQAEKVLEVTIEESRTILARSTTLIGILSGLTLVTAGFCATKLETLLNFNLSTEATVKYLSLAVPSAVLFAYVTILLLMAVVNLAGVKFLGKGSEPMKTLRNLSQEAELLPETLMLKYYILEIARYQKKIKKNEIANNRRSLRFHSALQRTLIIPIITILLFIIPFLTHWAIYKHWIK